MAPTNQGGRKAGQGNYGKEETKHLLDILENYLPIGPEEWETAAQLHDDKFPGRDVESIRRKFSNLYRKSIPTGDPNMPPEVRQAKRIKYKIGDRANIGDGEEEFGIEDGFNNNNPPSEQPSPPTQEDFSQLLDDATTENTGVNTGVTADASSSVSRSTSSSTGGGSVARTPTPRTLTPSSNSAASKRSYTSRGSSSDFLEAFQMSIMEQREAGKQEREDRKLFIDSLSAIAQGVASAFAPKKKSKKRKRKSMYDTDSAAESSDSD